MDKIYLKFDGLIPNKKGWNKELQDSFLDELASLCEKYSDEDQQSTCTIEAVSEEEMEAEYLDEDPDFEIETDK